MPKPKTVLPDFPAINVFDPELSVEYLEMHTIRCLWPRELQVLARIGKGMRTKDIADDLCLGCRTIDYYRHNIMLKLNFSSIAEEAVLAWRIRDALQPYLARPLPAVAKSWRSVIDNVDNSME